MKLPETAPQESQSPSPSLPEPHEASLDEGVEGEGTTETPSASYHTWIKSPERGGLSFSSVNSNLRDLTPSHTLDMGAFSEATSYYPCAEEGGNAAFTRSLSGDASEGAGAAQNPPQKKKVRLSAPSLTNTLTRPAGTFTSSYLSLFPRCLCWNTGNGNEKLGEAEAPRSNAALRFQQRPQWTSSLSPWKQRPSPLFLWLLRAPRLRSRARSRTPPNRERKREETDSGTFHSL